MIAKEGIWEALQDVFAKAFTKSNSEWFEKTLGIKSDKFFEHVAIETIAVLSATAIIAFVGFIGSRHIWRTIHRRFRAATIRKTSSAAFVIVLCPIANDSNEAIGNEIAARLETAFRAFAGWGEAGGRPFHVMGFPLALSGEEGSKAYDKAIETAKRWLERTDGDILIWGKRVKGESVGIVRLIGKDRKNGVIEVRRVDFDRRAADFDQALANAIAYEAARLTQVTLLEPELLNLETLREVSNKLKKLAASDAPALSNKWRERMAAEHWRLTEEIVRRTPSEEERKNLEAQARIEISGVGAVKYLHRFAELALRIGTLTRKRNWIDPDPGELDEARSFLTKAGEIFEAAGDIRRAAEAAVECAKVRRQQLIFLRLKELHKETIYGADIKEAQRLTELADDEGLEARLAAATCLSTNDSVAQQCGFDLKGPSGAFEFVNGVSRYLDNGELIDLAFDLESALLSHGDKRQSIDFWRAPPQLVEAILNSRSYWAPDERTYLSALIAGASNRAASRLACIGEADTAAPVFEIGNRLSARIFNLFKQGSTIPRRYGDIKALACIGGLGLHELEVQPSNLEALRICAGHEADRFPQIQFEARKALIVSLNNRAAQFDSLEIAEEALHRSVELEEEETYGDDPHAHYISAYACWQAARLMPRSDSSTRTNRSLKGHSLAETALTLANEQGNQYFVIMFDLLLKFIEDDFPELAVNSEAINAAATKGPELPPDSYSPN